MKRFQCPLEAYDAIMDWAEFATSNPSFDFSLGSVGNKRGSVVAALTKHMGMEGLRPFVSEVVVPTHAKPVEIICFQFSHALDSMFSDRSLMKPPNLVINQPLSGKDPYALYESPGNLLNEVHSGSSFQKMTGFCGDASPLRPSDLGRLDIIIKDFIRLLRCTARALFPQCDFTNGLTNLTLTTTNENSGAIFYALASLGDRDRPDVNESAEGSLCRHCNPFATLFSTYWYTSTGPSKKSFGQ